VVTNWTYRGSFSGGRPICTGLRPERPSGPGHARSALAGRRVAGAIRPRSW